MPGDCTGVLAHGVCVGGLRFRAGVRPGWKSCGGKTFTAEKGGQKVSFSTDKAGNFSVYLDPGTYVVHFSDDATVQGVVHGYPQSTTEDIHLTKKK